MFELDIAGRPQFDDRLIAAFAAQREANQLKRAVTVTDLAARTVKVFQPAA